MKKIVFAERIFYWENIFVKILKLVSVWRYASMFEVGDFVIYGNSGVCKVEKIGTLELIGMQKGRLYYTLIPVYQKGSKIFTPMDNRKVIMRRVISQEEALKLIDTIKEIDTLWLEDSRRREEIYKESMRKCDCLEWIKIIKTLYLRKQSRIAEGKKTATSDEKYFNLAEESLYDELAISLQMDRTKVKEYVIERVDH